MVNSEIPFQCFGQVNLAAILLEVEDFYGPLGPELVTQFIEVWGNPCDLTGIKVSSRKNPNIALFQISELV